MRHFLIAIAFTFMTGLTAHAQDKISKHTVEKGETVTQIAQLYKVTPADIYRLNPDAQNGLKPGMIILIQGGKAAKTADATKKADTPKKSDVPKTAKTQTYVVAAGETAYGIAKKFEVSVADLEKANPAIKNGLKTGDTLFIPAAKAQVAAANPKENKEKEPKAEKEGKTEKEKKKGKEIVYHTIEAKETKYSIAKKYGISIEELEAANPDVKGGLQIGYRLKIVEDPKVRPQAVETKEDKPVVVKPEPKKPEFQEYTVKPKETLYGLSKRFEISQDELVKMNPEIKDGVREGSVLKLPMNVQFSNNVKEASGLSKTLNTSERRKLAILLPFNISKMQIDTANSITSRLKTDKFLNMTLDFYSGALMAIDSAKTLGLNIDVRILDSQETKNASAVATLIQQNDLAHMDAVIGPFYQANVEKTAELLSKSNVPVISPLSKETGKLYPNLLQSMTQEDYVKDAMYGYMVSKGANIIAIVDPKKLSVKKYLSENQKSVKAAPFVNGTLSVDGLKALLQKGMQNYIVLETENTMMIKTTINTLLAAVPDYQVQLVITGQNDTLDYEEIQVANLAKLKLMYPSLIRDNDTPEALIFEKNYKEKNKVFPNRYATRGFDVTFDTLLRLSQEKTFVETLDTVATEQVDNKFDYEKKSSGAFVNTGFYILYYDTDLSVKQAEN